MYKNALYLTLGFAFSLAPIFAGDPHYVFTTVDFPGASSTQVAHINNRGEIAGLYNDVNGVFRAFYETNGVLTTVPGLAGQGPSEAGKVNKLGMVVGDYLDGSGIDHSFLFQTGSPLLTLDAPGAKGTQLVDVNALGTVMVGFVLDQKLAAHGVIRDHGSWTTFDYPGDHVSCTVAASLSDFGYVVGTVTIPGPAPKYPVCPGGAGEEHGYIRLPDKTFILLDVPHAQHQTVPLGINNFGMIVGGYADGNRTHGFLLADGRFTSIDVPGSTFTVVFGINDLGEITGTYKNEGGTPDCPATAPCGNFHGFRATLRH
ncbi:MAG TPA: hypothetical protein VMH81_04065 [Bryobacteraceae bacterium]|nr:hypothetical protein [Bryobacteraceae bacterium]